MVGPKGISWHRSHFEPSTSAIDYAYGFLPVLLKLLIPVEVSKPLLRSLLEPLAADSWQTLPGRLSSSLTRLRMEMLDLRIIYGPFRDDRPHPDGGR
ncbi:MAG: hypothetical protein QW828_06310 [Candidatus Bathyarchaeia archaeon]